MPRGDAWDMFPQGEILCIDRDSRTNIRRSSVVLVWSSPTSSGVSEEEQQEVSDGKGAQRVMIGKPSRFLRTQQTGSHVIHVGMETHCRFLRPT